MKTSSFSNHTGPGGISIARYAPKTFPKDHLRFPALAPGSWFNSVTKEKYRELYFAEILSALDARETLDKLQGLAGAAEPILLCWEKAPLTEKNWCHRRLVAEWLGDKLGVTIAECGAAERQLSLLGKHR